MAHPTVDLAVVKVIGLDSSGCYGHITNDVASIITRSEFTCLP